MTPNPEEVVNKIVLLTRNAAFIVFKRDKSLRKEMTFREFRDYHAASGVTLASGAKLYKSHANGYFIAGYNYDGSDTAPYRKFAR